MIRGDEDATAEELQRALVEIRRNSEPARRYDAPPASMSSRSR